MGALLTAVASVGTWDAPFGADALAHGTAKANSSHGKRDGGMAPSLTAGSFESHTMVITPLMPR
jgi:hypothetical protein